MTETSVIILHAFCHILTSCFDLKFGVNRESSLHEVCVIKRVMNSPLSSHRDSWERNEFIPNHLRLLVGFKPWGQTVKLKAPPPPPPSPFPLGWWYLPNYINFILTGQISRRCGMVQIALQMGRDKWVKLIAVR